MKHIIPQTIYWIIAVAIMHQIFLDMINNFTESNVWSAILLNYVGIGIVSIAFLALFIFLALVVALFTDEVTK